MRGWATAMMAVVVTVATPLPAAAQIKRTIRLQNDCRSPIEVVVRHADNGRNWHNHGWYQIAGRRSTTLENNGVTLQQEEGLELYAYARSTDGTNQVWAGENRQSFGEATYPFAALLTSVSSSGALVASFTCD